MNGDRMGRLYRAYKGRERRLAQDCYETCKTDQRTTAELNELFSSVKAGLPSDEIPEEQLKNLLHLQRKIADALKSLVRRMHGLLRAARIILLFEKKRLGWLRRFVNFPSKVHRVLLNLIKSARYKLFLLLAVVRKILSLYRRLYCLYHPRPPNTVLAIRCFYVSRPPPALL